MLAEILEIPHRADDFLRLSPNYTLPLNVPYIGMGSSYFAPLSFKYMGLPIQPEMASEYAHYLHGGGKAKNAVLLSQSGRSTEVLWCKDLFEQYTAITNNPESALANGDAIAKVVPLLAGEEKQSSSKTYINTLLALFKGFGIDTAKSVKVLQKSMAAYEAKGKSLAEAVFAIVQQQRPTGIYITGSGPNIGTALQAALILSESTKLAFTGLPMAQYDHGPKETANESVVIQIVARGKAYERTKALSETVRKAGAHVFEVEEPAVTEVQSILNNSVPFNFMAHYLSQLLGVQEIFTVGGKVTEVNAVG